MLESHSLDRSQIFTHHPSKQSFIMSGLESWEDDPAAQDDSNLQRQAQNLNINDQPNTFRPGANSFQPGASTFQPGQQFQQYNGYSQQQYGYGQQQGYGGYPQYGQPDYSQYNMPQRQQQPGGYNQNYGGQFAAYNQGPGSYQPQQQQQQPRQTPISIAKRPTGDLQPAPSPAPAPAKSENVPPPKAKVLSIGAEVPKAKVLSIGVPTSAPATSAKPDSPTTKDAPSAAAGARMTAVKAVEKTGAITAANGKSTPALSSGKSSPTLGDKKAVRDADAVAKEQAADVDEETLQEVYGKEHVNLIFIGHVDAGKSTLGGSLLNVTGMVDERTLEKYKKDAKEAGRETWYLSWVLDLNKEERAKGKTVEVGTFSCPIQIYVVGNARQNHADVLSRRSRIL
jgi:peptide chain release factor subunit 3